MGARSPRAQFSAPARKPLGARKSADSKLIQRYPKCGTRGAFRYARGERAPRTSGYGLKGFQTRFYYAPPFSARARNRSRGGRVPIAALDFRLKPPTGQNTRKGGAGRTYQPELRSPKSETRKKSEARSPKPEWSMWVLAQGRTFSGAGWKSFSAFGFRPSFGFREIGFRNSGSIPPVFARKPGKSKIQILNKFQ